MDIENKSPELVAHEILDKFTGKLFDSGHEISKPLITDCALIACNYIRDKFADQPTEREFWFRVIQQIKAK